MQHPKKPLISAITKPFVSAGPPDGLSEARWTDHEQSCRGILVSCRPCGLGTLLLCAISRTEFRFGVPLQLLAAREGSRKRSELASDSSATESTTPWMLAPVCVRVAAMAVRKSIEESLVVDGPRADWLQKCRTALETQGFTRVEANETLGQITANYKKATTWGDLLLTLTPEGSSDATRITAKATANVDNLFAAFRSPGQKIIDQFKAGLS